LGTPLRRSEAVGVTVDRGLVCENVGSFVAKLSRARVDAPGLRGSVKCGRASKGQQVLNNPDVVLGGHELACDLFFVGGFLGNY
jgi:hypothetical protein